MAPTPVAVASLAYGVEFGHAVLGDPLTPTFVGATLLVGAGIVLVDLRTLPMRARAAP